VEYRTCSGPHQITTEPNEISEESGGERLSLDPEMTSFGALSPPTSLLLLYGLEMMEED
jgi:hypothetical protein